ncbi:dystrotelin-like [Micropterus dolomieu]|uniref:dystrotelin-like n=1 Tax=Micropterus dolomieu TaxID=147949 RepID=UPI001E8D61B8|nr:dystrotelin-like [Micropterus dolomieu]
MFRLLEEHLQAWRLAVQSEQGILEDRCSEMEVTMDKLREHNLSLQGVLTQALNRMEAQQHANNTPRGVDSETNTDEEEEEVLLNVQMEAQQHANNAPQSVEEDEEEEVLLKTEDEWSEDKEKTPSPTIHLDTPVSYDTHCEEEDAAGDRFLCHPVGQQDEPEEAEPQEENTCLSEEEEKHYGTCSPEELLQETVERLKLVMETDRWRERQTGERKRAELLEAAGQVGDSIHHLVDAVRTNT